MTLAAPPQTKPALTPQIVAASRLHPEFYFREVLGHEQVPDYLVAIAHDVRDHRETRVQSGRGVGKSWVIGNLASWWFDCFPNSGAFITGTVSRQVTNAYGECTRARRNARFELPGRILDTGIKGHEKWFVQHFAAKDADSALGGHADYVLVLVDESSGMDPRICETLYGCLSGPNDRILWSGNPLHVSGHFADLAGKPHVRNHTISVKQTVNYVAGEQRIRGIAGREYEEHVAANYGRDSDVYRVHVLGLMPREGGNALFSLSAIEDAKRRGDGWTPGPDDEEIGGLDLARLGGDRCGLLTLRGPAVWDVETWAGRTLDHTLDRARAWLSQRPKGKLMIDATSEGTFSDVLVREFPGRVFGVNFGGPPALGHTLPKVRADDTPRPLYQNRRAEMWYEAAKWTATEAVWPERQVPEDKLAELEVDLLSAVRIDPTPAGSMRMEKKEAARKRLGRSPDLGDAYCLAVAGLLKGAAPIGYSSARTDAASMRAAGRLRYSHRHGRMVPAGGAMPSLRR